MGGGGSHAAAPWPGSIRAGSPVSGSVLVPPWSWMKRRTRSRMAMKSGLDFTARASSPARKRRQKSSGMTSAMRPGRGVMITSLGRQEDRLLDLVRDEERHLPRPRPDRQDQLLNLLAGEGVERAERLVHEQHARIGGERPGNADALLHAAGELVDPLPREVGKPDEVEHRAGPRLALGPRHALHPQAEGDVLQHAEPGHQGVALEHHAAVGPRPGDRAPVEENPSFGRRLEAGDAVEQRRLPAARSAERHHELPRLDRQVDPGQGEGRALALAVLDAELGDLQHGSLLEAARGAIGGGGQRPAAALTTSAVTKAP